ncbi:MAG: tetratricopeptide repeat protein [Burkholderiales bacterium]|nr:tetratricopeptide repeat protein [Bacteroidia bacterium]
MKKIVVLFILSVVLFSCKPAAETVIENSQRTDSLLKVINSPELAAVNKKILNEPGDANLYNERARIYMQFRQFEEAINDSKRSLRMDSTNAAYYLTEADVFFAANETRNAKDVLEKVVKKFPENTDGLLKLGELYYFVKQYENAFVKINQALKINENLAKAYYLKGSIYKEMGDTSKAVSSLETAIEQDNKNFGAFLDLGLIYAAKKNALAFEYYNNALSINPLSIEALYAKAKLQQDFGQIKEAVLLYNQILKTNATHVFSMYNLGAIEFGINKNPQKAIDYFTSAINVNPKYAEAYFARGACYQELKDKPNALADYNMCLQLKPNYEPAVDGLNSLGK